MLIFFMMKSFLFNDIRQKRFCTTMLFSLQLIYIYISIRKTLYKIPCNITQSSNIWTNSTTRAIRDKWISNTVSLYNMKEFYDKVISLQNVIYSKEFSQLCRLYLNETRFFTMDDVYLYKIIDMFHDTVISLQYTKRKFFMTHVVLFFKYQNIRLIKPQISNTQVHKCTPGHGG